MIKYTKEQREFIIANNYMKTAKELANMFNKEFGTNITAVNIKTFRHNNHLNSGLTGRFEKGNTRVYDLYLMRDKVSDFLKEDNKPILSSDFGDTVEDLIHYLKNHNGFIKEW